MSAPPVAVAMMPLAPAPMNSDAMKMEPSPVVYALMPEPVAKIEPSASI